MGKILREELIKIMEVTDEDKPQYLIAKEIINQLNLGKKLNSTEIAANTFTSRPTVIRFAQSLGFPGFKEMNKRLVEQDAVYYFPVATKSYDDAFQEYQKLIQNFLLNFSNSELEKIKAIANSIERKRRIFIFSSSENYFLANFFADRLRYIGIEVWSAINSKQLWLVNNIQKHDLVIFLVTGFDNQSLVQLWEYIYDFAKTVLIATVSQQTRFRKPDYLFTLNMGQNVLRDQVKYFFISYILDQIYNLLVYSDEEFISGIVDPKHRF